MRLANRACVKRMSDNRVKITTVARLRELLATLEREIGLESLSTNELNVLYVVRLLCDDATDSSAEASDIREHAITKSMSQPTLNRTIRSLLEKGYLDTAPNYKAKHYKLGPKTA